MGSVQVRVSKEGTLVFNDGEWYLAQNREIFRINHRLPPENFAGHFSAKLPDGFDLHGRDAESRKVIKAMLEKGKEIAGLNKKKRKR